MKALFAATVVSVALVTAPAFAQNAQPADKAAPPAASQPNNANKMMLKGHWRASKLMGLDVYNENNEKLGDVNEIILDKSGKVAAVVIGVGGFLGMGEHDIAVTMDKLKFVEEPARTTSSTTTKDNTASTTTTGTSANNNARNNTARSANDWVPDHAVMNANKDQLKAMPEFKYSDYN